MQLLSPHLSLEELTFSSTAVAHGIDNTASPEIVEHLAALAASFLPARRAAALDPASTLRHE